MNNKKSVLTEGPKQEYGEIQIQNMALSKLTIVMRLITMKAIKRLYRPIAVLLHGELM